MSVATDTAEETTHQSDELSRDALLVMLQEKTQQIDTLEQRVETKQHRINFLEEALRLSKQKRFGKSSEQNLLQGQLLFDEAESLSNQSPDDALPSGELDADDEADPVSKKRKGNRTGRQPLSADLPRVQQYFFLSEEERAGASDTFFTKVKEELDIVPAKACVIEYYQEKAVFNTEDGKRAIIAAKRTPHPLGKTIASVTLLAYIISSKYADGIPLYRLETILKRYGGSISRSAMALWMVRLSLQLQPVVNLLEETLLSGDYLQGDETRMKVLKEPGMKPSSHKWVWLMRGGPPDKPVVMFNYDKSRGKAVAKRLLADYEGRYFQSDGYAGYDEACRLKQITHLGCWDHARRGFTDAIKAAPTPKKSAPLSKATMALSKINTLYRIERKIADLSAQEKQAYRQQHSVPALQSLHEWLTTQAPKIEKGSLTRKAMDYVLNQWPKLIRYCDDGTLRISNILAENAIRPFAVGRKSWMFADTPEGAKASMIYYTLIETAKANGLEPFDYLQQVVKHIALAKNVEDYERLLPWNIKEQVVK